MIKLSIIIPVFKVEAYIKRCLQSVMSQTWKEDDIEIECLLIDDCTPDNSMLLAKQLIADYEGNIRFVCLQHEKNSGLSAARNTGLKAATGDYVFFMDSDDYLKPDSIAAFTHAIVSHQDVDVFLAQIEKVQNHSILLAKIHEPTIIVERDEVLKSMLVGDIYIEAWNKFIRRSLLTEHQISFIEGIYFEDVTWSYQLYSHAQKVMMIPQVTYVYDYNPSGIMAQSVEDKRLEKVLRSFAVILQYLLDHEPDKSAFGRNIVVEYLIAIHIQMTRSLQYVQMKKESDEQVLRIYELRKRLMKHSLKSGRISMICFTLLLFNPLYQLFRLHTFRKNYYYLQKTVARTAHLTDFLH